MIYIGTLAKLTGASRKAIYLYESLGLISTPARKGNYRVYTQATVEQVRLIRCAQSLGFRLKELAAALSTLPTGEPQSLALISQQIAHKRDALQQQIDAAQAQIDLLDGLQQQLRDAPEGWWCEEGVDSPPKGKV